MEQIFSSLIPIFSLIVMGYLFKKISFPSNDFWPMADKLTYYILMPALLIFTLSKAKLDSNSVDLVLVSIFAIFLTMFFLIIFNKISPTLNNSFTSVVQGGIRFNTYVFLALSSSLFGEKGLIFSAIIITFAIPILNIFCITIFAIYSENSKISFSYILKSIFKNLLKILSGAALPLGLISIGYNLVIKEINSGKKDIILSSFAKFLLLPFFIYFIGKMFELEEVMISVLVLFAIMPTAPTSFILARQLNGNLSLMTSIITVQTILAFPILIFYIKYLI